jgi:hypothetical protein
VTRLTIALFNYENGGFRSSILGGVYDFRPLQHAVAQAEVVPALFAVLRVEELPRPGGPGEVCGGRSVVGRAAGCAVRGRVGFDGAGTDPGVYDDQRHVARFAIRDSAPVAESRTEFLAFVHHFEPVPFRNPVTGVEVRVCPAWDRCSCACWRS